MQQCHRRRKRHQTGSKFVKPSDLNRMHNKITCSQTISPPLQHLQNSLNCTVALAQRQEKGACFRRIFSRPPRVTRTVSFIKGIFHPNTGGPLSPWFWLTAEVRQKNQSNLGCIWIKARGSASEAKVRHTVCISHGRNTHLSADQTPLFRKRALMWR